MHAIGAEETGLTRAEYEAIVADAACTPGLPNRAYTSEAFFEWERHNLFARTWMCIGNACRVPNPGDVLPLNFMRFPLVMVRNGDHQVRVFHNVCSHRGNELVWEAGNQGPRIRCPYHAWTYDLDGRLKGTPHIGGVGTHEVEGFCKDDYGLKTVRSEVWMDLVFVDLSGVAPAFLDFIAPLKARVDRLATPEQFSRLGPAGEDGQLTVEFRGNWKLDLENNLEAYHLPWVHPDLNSISKLEDHYQYFSEGLFAGQGSYAYDHRRDVPKAFPEMDGWPAGVSEYPTLFPNVFLGLHCDHFWTRVIEPVSPGVTLDHTQIYYLDGAAKSDEFAEGRALRMKAWAKVFGEDIGVVEGMQRGRQSAAFDGGVFTPVMDAPSQFFARWIAGQLRRAV